MYCSVTLNCLVKSFTLTDMKASHRHLEKVKEARFFETRYHWLNYKTRHQWLRRHKAVFRSSFYVGYTILALNRQSYQGHYLSSSMSHVRLMCRLGTIHSSGREQPALNEVKKIPLPSRYLHTKSSMLLKTAATLLILLVSSTTITVLANSNNQHFICIVPKQSEHS